MDPFLFAPIAAIFNVAYAAVEGLAAAFTPAAGAASAAAAIVALTIIVRLALIPVGVSQVKAEGTRRRLTPQLLVLQRKHKSNPLLLQQKTTELYKAEKSSQFAGILPTLAQAPVLSLVYALFLRTTVDGHPNALLSEHLFAVPLGTSFVHVLSTGHLWSQGGVFLALFVIMAAVAWMSRRIALRLALPNPDAAPGTDTVTRVLSWLPFITVIFWLS
jgi:YidC/Oxa1 family membrane protein insertase